MDPTKSPAEQRPHSLDDPQIQNVLEADPDEIDPEDDAYSSDGGSRASTSLSRGVRDYMFENNRRYHKYKEGRYLIPNDEPEQEREDMKHVMIVSLCNGKLHSAPLDNPQKILDIGTGTGIWAIDMGDEYPEAEIIGIDLSPIQPTWVPPNVRFQVDDAEAEWLFQPDSLDLVHLRHMGAAVKNWPRLINQAHRAIRPGGWIELQDIKFPPRCDDNTMPRGSDYGFSRFVSLTTEGYSRFGVDLDVVTKFKDLLIEGRFTRVEEVVWKIPIGTWPIEKKLKTVGLYHVSVISDALQSEVEVFLVDVRKSLSNPNIHAYTTFHSVFGQKPAE